MIAIPNMEMPKKCIEELDYGLLGNPCLFVDERNACLLQDDSKMGEYEENYKTCPLIEIDESEMEYLYKEFGLEKDENLTDGAKELKRAILMGYLYAKSSADQDVEQEEWYDWRDEQEYEDRWNTMERGADEL